MVLVTISFHRRKVKRNSLHILEKIVSFCFAISVDQNNTPLSTGTGLPPDIEQETFSNLAEAFRECPDCQFPDYLWILQQNGLWPTQTAYDSNTPASLIRKLQKFRVVVSYSGATASSSCQHCKSQLKAIIRACGEAASAMFEGLCLDCVKHRDRRVERPYVCRTKHSGFQGICGSIIRG